MDAEFVLAPQHTTKHGTEQFCEVLHSICTNVDYGIQTAQCRKHLYLGREYLTVIFGVVPLVPGSRNFPQENVKHTYIEVGRFDDQTTPSFFGLFSYAKDETFVIGREELDAGGDDKVYCKYEDVPQPNLPGERVASMSWRWWLPNLIDVFEFLAFLSFTYPHHNVLIRPRHWLAHAIFDMFQNIYSGHHDHIGDDFWRRDRMTFGLPLEMHSWMRLKKDCRDGAVKAGRSGRLV